MFLLCLKINDLKYLKNDIFNKNIYFLEKIQQWKRCGDDIRGWLPINSVMCPTARSLCPRGPRLFFIPSTLHWKNLLQKAKNV